MLHADATPVLGVPEGTTMRVPLTFSGPMPPGGGVNMTLSHPACAFEGGDGRPGVIAVFGCNVTAGFAPTPVAYNVTSGGARARACALLRASALARLGACDR
jgi:hypothetical protein